MTAAIALPQPRLTADTALRSAVALWLLVALIGQWAFFYYIAAFYGAATLSGDFESWAVLSKMGATAYVKGDTAGNLTFGAHAMAAGVVALGGALQLIPQIRTRFPRFHRWNGRAFLVIVLALSLSGFWLVWVRGSAPNQLNGISTTINGVLILSFAALAWRTAVARRFAVHRRWAIRLFLVSNAQWFLRVGVFGYFIVNMGLGRKVGMGDPFLMFWTFGCYAVPLAVAELYMRARDRAGPAFRATLAGALVALTLLMGVGIAGFTMFSIRLISGAPLALPG